MSTFKLLLMGDSGTGKSSLLLRFVDNKFLGENTHHTTIGVDFKVRNIEVDGKTIKLTIWDTAGQERFRALTSSYYRGAQGIILVYDITNRQSFENLHGWIKELDTYSNIQNSVKMVVGNKTDLESSRQVSPQEGRDYAKSIGALFTESSAKTNDSVQDAFLELVRKIIESPTLITTDQTHIVLAEPDSTAPKSCSCG